MRKHFILGVALLACSGCAQMMESPEVRPVPDSEGTIEILGKEAGEENIEKGRLNVHVSEAFAAELEESTGEDGWVRIPDTKASVTGAVSMRRLFPYAGEFEARTRQEGLHLWYEVEYNPSIPISKAAGDFNLPGDIDIIEFPLKVCPAGGDEFEYVDETSRNIRQTASEATALFNDPMLKSQWHYYNDGSNNYSVSGCDINVLPVWKSFTTGDESVIVSVVDGGVDFSHEDLADNMWHNPEKKGNYQYGYNFVDDNFQVVPDSHGTHVAGTIAAVNNNGKGVCGVAGGNAAARTKGVKIMSCQIIKGEKSADGAKAIKWSADHGAVISQNSWGYTQPMPIPSSLKAAVEYFIKYAGCDKDGKQTGPIKGGIVLFSAGNNGSEEIYGTVGGGVLNVAAIGADFRKAYYSNYGSWVDITAPGGDVSKGSQVLSTLPGNKYGYMQGTSMACPHVSGVTALLVSYMKGSGVTNTKVVEALKKNATDISAFNRIYGMGTGLVNAYRSIVGKKGKVPDIPTGLAVTNVVSNNLSIEVEVPKDDDDGTPTSVQVYFSTSAFREVGGVEYVSFYVGDLKAGDVLRGEITGLEFDTTYYLGATAQDLAGNQSGLSPLVTARTQANILPQINFLNGDGRHIKPFQSDTVKFEIVNPARHFYQIELEREDADTLGIVLDTLDKAKPSVIFKGPALRSAAHTATLIVTDVYDATVRKTVSCTVDSNNPPRIKKQLPDVMFVSKSAAAVRYRINDYFEDPDGEPLTYTITATDGGEFANMVAENGNFILTPMEYGYTTFKVKGTDVRGESAEQGFRVLVSSSAEVEAYPNPVKTDLYVRMAKESAANVRIVSATGAVVFEGDFNISPFEPARVDMSDCPAGVYSLIVKCADKEYKSNLVKI